MNTVNIKRENIPKSTSQWRQMLQLPRAVHILVLGSFVNRLGTFVLPYMALYLTQKGYDLSQVGYALAAWGGGALLSSIIGGHLADTLGRRTTIAISMIGCAVMVFLLAHTTDLYLFTLFAFLTALFADLYRPASHALVADLVDEKDRVLVYALMRWAINAGFAFGPALAGFLSQISYLWVFYLDAATSLSFGLLAACLLPKIENRKLVPISHVWKAFSSLKQASQVCLGDLKFVQIFIASFFIAFAFFQCFSTLGLEVKSRSFTEVYYGFILGLNGLLIVFLELPISSWVRKGSQRMMISLGFFLIGLGVAFFAFGKGLPLLYVGMTVMTFGEMIAMPVCLAYVSSMAPSEMRGRYMGMWGFSWGLAMVFATSGGVRLFGIMGSWFWLFVAFLGFLAGAAMLVKTPSKSVEKNVKNREANLLSPSCEDSISG